MKFLQKHTVLLILLIGFIGLGFVLFQGYGVGWDEDVQRKTGLISFNYIFNNDLSLNTWKDRDYGVGFELILIFIEKAFHLTDLQTIFWIRHIVTYLFFLIGAVTCFLLIDKLYQNKWLSIFAFLLFIIHPKILGHAFINTKDIPFLSMFMICIYLLHRVYLSASIRNILLLAIGTGFLINLRILGVMMIAAYCYFAFFSWLKHKSFLKTLLDTILFFGIASLVLYVTWPFLWKNPIDNFTFAFKNMSKFRFDDPVLFFGKTIPANKQSWNYIPIWFVISTPIVYLFLGSIGIVYEITNGVKNIKNVINDTSVQFMTLIVILFAGPVFIIIALKSVVYDDWRQLYFIYAPFVILCISGLHLLSKQKKYISFSIIFVQFGLLGYHIGSTYPHHYIYFNEFLIKNDENQMRNEFDLDYWGLSYRKSLEYIAKSDTSEFIYVSVGNNAGKYNSYLLDKVDRDRIKFTSFDSSTYYVSNYRYHPQDYTEHLGKEVFNVKWKNNTINSVFKIK